MRVWPLPVFFAGIAIFVVSVHSRGGQLRPVPDVGVAVVVPAGIQLLMFSGDRYLAANLNATRAVVSTGGFRPDEAEFRARAHDVTAQLNPCQEDNYWIGNAEMTWGGAPTLASSLLRRATNCRFWDHWPPFFLGFNAHFFERNRDLARTAFAEAAGRADEKTAAAIRSMSVGLLIEGLDDAKMAMETVASELRITTDPRLQELLRRRLERLRGLIQLRDAGTSYQRRYGKNPEAISDLVQAGLLAQVPQDPTGLGYVLEKGEFQLARFRHDALESLR